MNPKFEELKSCSDDSKKKITSEMLKNQPYPLNTSFPYQQFFGPCASAPYSYEQQYWMNYDRQIQADAQIARFGYDFQRKQQQTQMKSYHNTPNRMLGFNMPSNRFMMPLNSFGNRQPIHHYPPLKELQEYDQIKNGKLELASSEVKKQENQNQVIEIDHNLFQKRIQPHGKIVETSQIVHEERKTAQKIQLQKSRAQKGKIRREKVLAYLQKRKRRTFCLKINYVCRKQVADNRIRFRGRFMNIEQAKSLLKIPSNSEHTVEDIKLLIKNMKNKH